jgi:hypothetical protein
MTLRADLPAERLLAHIKTSGLLTSFVDIDGNNQGATPSTAGMINMDQVSADSRAVQVRAQGNDQLADSEVNMEQLPCSVYVFSKRELSDVTITEGLTRQLREWLRSNKRSADDCIVSIQSFGLGGPFIAEEGRVYYELPLLVRFVL